NIIEDLKPNLFHIISPSISIVKIAGMIEKIFNDGTESPKQFDQILAESKYKGGRLSSTAIYLKSSLNPNLQPLIIKASSHQTLLLKINDTLINIISKTN